MNKMWPADTPLPSLPPSPSPIPNPSLHIHPPAKHTKQSKWLFDYTCLCITLWAKAIVITSFKSHCTVKTWCKQQKRNWAYNETHSQMTMRRILKLLATAFFLPKSMTEVENYEETALKTHAHMHTHMQTCKLYLWLSFCFHQSHGSLAHSRSQSSTSWRSPGHSYLCENGCNWNSV